MRSIAPAVMEAPPATYFPVTGLTRFTARFHLPGFQFADELADFVDRQSTPGLFSVWLGLALLFGVVYWMVGLLHHSGLWENGRWVDGSRRGLLSAIYFSFVTVTSVGYGDVVPRGLARVAAVGEAIAGLLIF